MLLELSQLDPHPESVPINALVRAPGTPLAALPPIDPMELVRMIATTWVVFPNAMVRLSAGRTELSREVQLLCMYAGASSIFYDDRLLTTPNPARTGCAAVTFRAQAPSIRQSSGAASCGRWERGQGRPSVQVFNVG